MKRKTKIRYTNLRKRKPTDQAVVCEINELMIEVASSSYTYFDLVSKLTHYVLSGKLTKISIDNSKKIIWVTKGKTKIRYTHEAILTLILNMPI